LRVEDHRELIERQAQKYARPMSAWTALEEAAFGVAVGSNGYTGLEEAQALLVSLAVPANASVLDPGTGRGWPAWLIAIEGGHRVVGMDVPEGALRLARDVFEAAGLAQRTLLCAGDASALPFASGLFDAVTHVGVLC
jgi:cyclopropane fatty-acyl-phospholipid synthase-like methyltransferase